MNRIAALVLMVGLAAACDSPPRRHARTDSSAPQPKAVAAVPMLSDTITQVIVSDLDSDGRADTLVVHRRATGEGSGAFDSVRFVLSRSGTHSYAGSWDEPDSSLIAQLRGNRVPSRVTYVGRFAGAGTLVFLFGEDVGCCLQSLDIYRVSPAGVSLYHHEDEFGFTKPLVQADTVTSMEGIPFLTEFTGTTAPDALKASGYQPQLVIRLGETATLDTTATAAATRASEGGWAGVSATSSLVSILAKDSTRYLWDEDAGKKVP